MGSASRVEEWRPGPDGDGALAADLAGLGEVLRAVVEEGPGVTFVLPFPQGEAEAFWRERVLPGVRAGTRRLLVAREGERIVGTVHLELAMPPNQAHRAEVVKLLVHPAARRRGLARALMARLEEVAREEGRTLLTLDTITGSPAEALYRSMGWETTGVVPGFARGSRSPELLGATYMYRTLVDR